MTKAEKMAEEWLKDIPPGYYYKDVTQLIHQVAERTRQECAKAISNAEVCALGGLTTRDNCNRAALNAQWENENE